MKRSSRPDALVSDDPARGAPPEVPGAGPSGFARLAALISAWTGRLLVSAMLIVAALGFGRQVVLWWRGEAETAQPAPAPLPERLGDPAEPHVLRFGDQQWAILRREVAGDASAAGAALVEQCRRIAAELPAPPAGPTAEEAALVRRIVTEHPLAGRDGREAVYACAERWPMVVGLKWPPGDAAPADAPSRSAGNGPSDAGASSTGEGRNRPAGDGPLGGPGPCPTENTLARALPRVVTWGMAVPTSSEAWTLYIFQPEQNRGSSHGATAEIALPPGARHVLSMRAAGGGVTSFRGDAHPAQWAAFFDRWCAEHGWKPPEWQRSDETWLGTAAESDGASPGRAIRFWFAPDGRGGRHGLVLIAPEASR